MQRLNSDEFSYETRTRTIDVDHVPDLEAALSGLLRQIPQGRVTTYGDLAEALGDLGAARWIGEYLLDHPHNKSCHCHRVIRRTGELGLHRTRDDHTKRDLLQVDGVVVNGDRVDLGAFRFSQFESDRPLARLRALQQELPSRFEAEALEALPDAVAGVDVSYKDGRAVAAVAVVETATGELIDSATAISPVRFPYISGYLSFRELPALRAAIAELEKTRLMPEVVFVDGNGILHPRGAGIATHLGIANGLRTIGVGKKLLCGDVHLKALTADNQQPVSLDGRIIGAAVKAGERSRPIFVSPGHRMTVEDAVQLTRTLFRGHRLPEPIYFADRLSRERAQQEP